MYRCQSAHKLAELDAKFGIFKRAGCNTTLDLAAAPGGFAQVALERMTAAAAAATVVPARPSPMVIGVDLRPIEPLPGLVTVRCNILHHHEICKHVRRVMDADQRASTGARGSPRGRAVKVITHDGVSVVQGQRALSVTYSQNQMTLSALQLACIVLDTHGCSSTTGDGKSGGGPSFFVTKMMRSGHFSHVVRAAKGRFDTVEVHRPAACRPESRETYLVMWGLRRDSLKGRHGAAGDTLSNALFSLPPAPEDALHYSDRVVWFCLGCGQNRIGCRPCPVCSRAGVRGCR